MATRRQVREAFYAELESAASGHVDAGNISQEDPNSDEDLPAIVHADNYRKVPMNIDSAPVDVTTDSQGEQEYTYTSLIEARFAVTVVADDEQVKEDAYEAVRSYFEPYETPIKDVSNLQSDVYRVQVNDSTSQDFDDREPTARGDTLAINVSFQRYYTEDVDPTTDVVHEVDADDDGTTDTTYTTT